MPLSATAFAALVPADILHGRVALSIDGIGSNLAPVGNVQAVVPAGSKIERAYLYSAGTPFPWYANSPTTLADYNGAGISLAGTEITNFSRLVGATSTRQDIGRFFTARADVTPLVQSLVGSGGGLYSWSVSEGRLNERIDGEALVVAYSNPLLPLGSVVILDGGQNTGGETTEVSLGAPLGDTSAAQFIAQMSIGDSFSCCRQMTTIEINDRLLSAFAGQRDDGLTNADGSLISVGGIGDTARSTPVSYDVDQELYDLRPFLSAGDRSFKIFTYNATNDDNIFFMGLSLSGDIAAINDPGLNSLDVDGKGVAAAVPEPSTFMLLVAAVMAVFTPRAGRRMLTKMTPTSGRDRSLSRWSRVSGGLALLPAGA